MNEIEVVPKRKHASFNKQYRNQNSFYKPRNNMKHIATDLFRTGYFDDDLKEGDLVNRSKKTIFKREFKKQIEEIGKRNNEIRKKIELQDKIKIIVDFIINILSNLLNLFAVVIYIIQTIFEKDDNQKALKILKQFEFVFSLYFFIELIVFFIYNKHKIKFLISWDFFIDIITIFPPLITYFMKDVTIKFNLLRVFRIFRVFRILRIYKSIKRLINDQIETEDEFIYYNPVKLQIIHTITVLVCNIFIGAGLIIGLQEIIDGAFTGNKMHFVDALYFVITTSTTIGFGDIFPSHPATRLFCIFGMFYLIIVVGNQINKLGELMRIWGDGIVVYNKKGHLIVICDDTINLKDFLFEIKSKSEDQEIVIISKEIKYLPSVEYPYNGCLLITTDSIDFDVLNRANASCCETIFLFTNKCLNDSMVKEKLADFLILKINRYFKNVTIYTQSLFNEKLTKTIGEQINNTMSTLATTKKLSQFNLYSTIKANKKQIPVMKLKNFMLQKSFYNPGFLTFSQNLIFNDYITPQEIQSIQPVLKSYILGLENKIQVEPIPYYFVGKEFFDVVYNIYFRSIKDIFTKVRQRSSSVNRPILLIGTLDLKKLSSQDEDPYDIFPSGMIIKNSMAGIFICYKENNYLKQFLEYFHKMKNEQDAEPTNRSQNNNLFNNVEDLEVSQIEARRRNGEVYKGKTPKIVDRQKTNDAIKLKFERQQKMTKTLKVVKNDSIDKIKQKIEEDEKQKRMELQKFTFADKTNAINFFKKGFKFKFRDSSSKNLSNLVNKPSSDNEVTQNNFNMKSKSTPTSEITNNVEKVDIKDSKKELKNQNKIRHSHTSNFNLIDKSKLLTNKDDKLTSSNSISTENISISLKNNSIPKKSLFNPTSILSINSPSLNNINEIVEEDSELYEKNENAFHIDKTAVITTKDQEQELPAEILDICSKMKTDNFNDLIVNPDKKITLDRRKSSLVFNQINQVMLNKLTKEEKDYLQNENKKFFLDIDKSELSGNTESNNNPITPEYKKKKDNFSEETTADKYSDMKDNFNNDNGLKMFKSRSSLAFKPSLNMKTTVKNKATILPISKFEGKKLSPSKLKRDSYSALRADNQDTGVINLKLFENSSSELNNALKLKKNESKSKGKLNKGITFLEDIKETEEEHPPPSSTTNRELLEFKGFKQSDLVLDNREINKRFSAFKKLHTGMKTLKGLTIIGDNESFIDKQDSQIETIHRLTTNLQNNNIETKSSEANILNKCNTETKFKPNKLRFLQDKNNVKNKLKIKKTQYSNLADGTKQNLEIIDKLEDNERFDISKEIYSRCCEAFLNTYDESEDNPDCNAFYENRIINLDKVNFDGILNDHILIIGVQDSLPKLVKLIVNLFLSNKIVIVVPNNLQAESSSIIKLLKTFKNLYIYIGEPQNPYHLLNAGMNNAKLVIFLCQTLDKTTKEDMQNILSFKAVDYFFNVNFAMELWSKKSIKMIGYLPLDRSSNIIVNEFLHPQYMAGKLIYHECFDKLTAKCYNDEHEYEVWSRLISLAYDNASNSNGFQPKLCKNKKLGFPVIVTFDLPAFYYEKEYHCLVGDLLALEEPVIPLGLYIEEPLLYVNLKYEGGIDGDFKDMGITMSQKNKLKNKSQMDLLERKYYDSINLLRDISYSDKIVMDVVDLERTYLPVFITNPPPEFKLLSSIKVQVLCVFEPDMNKEIFRNKLYEVRKVKNYNLAFEKNQNSPRKKQLKKNNLLQTNEKIELLMDALKKRTSQQVFLASKIAVDDSFVQSEISDTIKKNRKRKNASIMSLDDIKSLKN